MRRHELHPRTAIINKTQKNLAKKARNDALQWLTATFPTVFDNTLSIQPLKIGIIDDILLHADKAAAAGISRSKLREAVVIFTRRIDYLACLKAKEMRVDLDGNPVSVVTEDEAERAAMKIRKRIEKSVRNARKVATPKAPGSSFSKPSTSKLTTNHSASYSTNDFSHYSERQPLYGTQTPLKQASAVVVKHKSTRQYDPEAVARLKEKLGLSRKVDEKEVQE